MPEDRAVTRRSYLKYAAAGIGGVAAAGAGAYYARQPTTTTIPQTIQTTATSEPSTVISTTQAYTRQEMPGFYKGVMFVQWQRENDRYIQSGMRELKERIPATGISVFLPYYTDSPTSSKIYPIYDTEGYGRPNNGYRLIESWPPKLVESTVDLAHNHGLRVAYWPNVGPITEHWPWENALDPTPAIFKAYREFKAEQASLAEELQCEMFWVGNEWNRSYPYGDEWNQILGIVRDKFSGQILVEFGFAGPSAQNIVLTKVNPASFNSMDYMGLSMNLYPMSSLYVGVRHCDPKYYSPVVSELVEKWQKPARAIEQAHKKFGKPILISELSAGSYDGAACEDYLFNPEVLTTERSVDYQEQADLFEAAMRTLTKLEFVHGVSWNQWNACEPGRVYPMDEAEKRSIEFAGKSAEKVLRYWYSKRDIRDGVGLLLTPDGHVDLQNLKQDDPLNERGEDE